LVRALVMRELDEGKRHDGAWLQAMSECNMDSAKAQVRYIELRMQAMQSDVKGLLVKQIRGALASDKPRSNGALADFLSAKDTANLKKK
jgi:hypothetical protein